MCWKCAFFSFAVNYKNKVLLRIYFVFTSSVIEAQLYFVALLWGKFTAPDQTKDDLYTLLHWSALKRLGFGANSSFLYSLLIVYSKFPLKFIYYHLITAQHLRLFSSWCLSSYKCVYSSCFICPHIEYYQRARSMPEPAVSCCVTQNGPISFSLGLTLDNT